MSFDKRSSDRQAQAQADTFSFACADLRKLFEDRGERVRTYSFAGISDHNFYFRIGARSRNRDTSAWGREFDRVRQQIAKYLLQTVNIAHYVRLAGCDPHFICQAASFERRPMSVDDVSNDGKNVGGPIFEADLA